MAQILDASIAVAWCARAQQSDLSVTALELVEAKGARVPPTFWFEVLHALAKLERRNSLASSDIAEFLTDAQTLGIQVDRAKNVKEMAEMRRLGMAYSLNIYDASYLELALRTGLPLITRDSALADAATNAGCTVLAL